MQEERKPLISLSASGADICQVTCGNPNKNTPSVIRTSRRADPSQPSHPAPAVPTRFPMAPLDVRSWPLKTTVLVEEGTTDSLPATYHYYKAAGKRVVGNPVEDTPAFLQRELSLGDLADMLRHLWFAGARRPAIPLHFHAAVGREITVVDRMDLHLLWTSDGKLLVKPIPRFLLHPVFCQSNLQCPKTPNDCTCRGLPADACGLIPRRVALGFLYTYACLISSENDFHIANEKRLLPRKEDDRLIQWADWKSLARELLQMYQRDPNVVHPRFQHAELRLSRINTIHCHGEP
ncbi:hypothetical protein QBC37DRAFT_487916 [Rhypophila decipiens]|uniref:Uncharacterized protein n=1 Tax=Rhypophila decipiens TaxID=261697 RepID=A0AAN6XW66_9PEZI|nr:hypothetical protein QBC37DRAFT_487916 [Rhypophila decipiens]